MGGGGRGRGMQTHPQRLRCADPAMCGVCVVRLQTVREEKLACVEMSNVKIKQQKKRVCNKIAKFFSKCALPFLDTTTIRTEQININNYN